MDKWLNCVFVNEYVIEFKIIEPIFRKKKNHDKADNKTWIYIYIDIYVYI